MTMTWQLLVYNNETDAWENFTLYAKSSDSKHFHEAVKEQVPDHMYIFSAVRGANKHEHRAYSS